MRDHRSRKPNLVSWSRFFWCTLLVCFSCVLLTGFNFSIFRLLFGGRLHPVIVSRWRVPAVEAISGEVAAAAPTVSIRETVISPDQALIFLEYPPSARLFAKEDLECVYVSAGSAQAQLKLPPASVDGEDLDDQIVRCPINHRGLMVSLALKSNGHILAAGPTHRWNSLVYGAMIDRDNTTIVFVKGLNLRPDRVSDASRYACLYGWDFRRPNRIMRSEVLSIGQEIARCRTPLSVLSGSRVNNSIKVSIRIKGRGNLHSIARLGTQLGSNPPAPKHHEMCICTMLRNQARFLKEWIMYHARIGVQRWFIYDNNSEDETEDMIELLYESGFNVTRHVWPWIKSQEAGFAHCALRARDVCEWVGFIDVDEFFHLQQGVSIGHVLQNHSSSRNIGEIRSSCYSFGPSGLKLAPAKGVTVGYTCRLAVPERHKSIVRPEALSSTLINVVHHFHLKDGFEFVDVDRGMMVINHYKYQVWQVFKEKFYRRVATYVADWQHEQNVGSKDRVPGLGTRAVEPEDWSKRFCEVRDTGLRDRVLQMFTDPVTQSLPWEEIPEPLLLQEDKAKHWLQPEGTGQAKKGMTTRAMRRRRRRKHRGFP